MAGGWIDMFRKWLGGAVTNTVFGESVEFAALRYRLCEADRPHEVASDRLRLLEADRCRELTTEDYMTQLDTERAP